MNRIGERAIKFLKFTPIVILISCIFFTPVLNTSIVYADDNSKIEEKRSGEEANWLYQRLCQGTKCSPDVMTKSYRSCLAKNDYRKDDK